MKEDLVAIPLPVRKKKIVYFQLSLNCCSLVLAHFRIWASSEFGLLCFLHSISTHSVSLCLCVSISSCMSLLCQRFLCVCVCMQRSVVAILRVSLQGVSSLLGIPSPMTTTWGAPGQLRSAPATLSGSVSC